MTEITEKRKQFYQRIASRRQKDFVLVLEDIHDSHNIAAILRSADAFGIQKIYLIFENQEEFDPRERKFRKSSAFTNKWLDFEVFDSTKICLEKLKSENFSIISTILDEEAQNFFETDFTKTKKIALVLGNEHKGISETVKRMADWKVYIPMQGFAESFNVSVAAAICLSEMTRQRKEALFHLSKKEQTTLVQQFIKKQIEIKEFKQEQKEERKVKAKKRHSSNS
ncbi:RNA methyltransferase [Candidatus Gracilibacteria bacterium]|nr:RNA methyltransferase [Candidatus Gracilibacteria bacterium]